MAQDQENAILERNKRFQLERIATFSDALFAIAITLLIFDLKLPELNFSNASNFLSGLSRISYNFFGFLFSFFFIGMYWNIHHNLFFHLKGFNKKFIILNTLLLLSIVILPFTTKISFENMTFPDYPFILYALNHIFTGITFYLIISFIDKNRQLTVGDLKHQYIKYRKRRSVSLIFIFVIVIIMSFINSIIARFTPLLIIPLLGYLRNKYRDSEEV